MAERRMSTIAVLTGDSNTNMGSNCPHFLTETDSTGKKIDLCATGDESCLCFGYGFVKPDEGNNPDEVRETVGLCRLHTIATDFGGQRYDVKRGQPRRITIN